MFRVENEPSKKPDDNFHNYRCEKLKHYLFFVVFHLLLFVDVSGVFSGCFLFVTNVCACLRVRVRARARCEGEDSNFCLKRKRFGFLILYCILQ
jgi:hypothetical protein